MVLVLLQEIGIVRNLQNEAALIQLDVTICALVASFIASCIFFALSRRKRFAIYAAFSGSFLLSLYVVFSAVSRSGI